MEHAVSCEKSPIPVSDICPGRIKRLIWMTQCIPVSSDLQNYTGSALVSVSMYGKPRKSKVTVQRQTMFLVLKTLWDHKLAATRQHFSTPEQKDRNLLVSSPTPMTHIPQRCCFLSGSYVGEELTTSRLMLDVDFSLLLANVNHLHHIVGEHDFFLFV